MAYGKPIITTRHTEIPRVVEHLLVDEQNLPQLVEALERVYHSASLRKELGIRSRELAEEHFSPHNVTDRLNLFASLVGAQVQPMPASECISAPLTQEQLT
jgi:colanic acid/amylovoran biosynthesis glycosyltransferase